MKHKTEDELLDIIDTGEPRGLYCTRSGSSWIGLDSRTDGNPTVVKEFTWLEDCLTWLKSLDALTTKNIGFEVNV